MKRPPRAIALVVVISVLALLLVIILSVTEQGIGSLGAVRVNTYGERSAYCAEAGVAQALVLMTQNRAYNTTIPLTPYGSSGDAAFQVEMVNNFAGTGPVTASNGEQVPAGFCYVLATGSRADRTYQRQVGVMLRGGTGSSLPYALSSGGGISLQEGQEQVGGSMKSNLDMNLKHTSVTPVAGDGRLLTAGAIVTAGGPTSIDSTQDARARGAIGNKLGGSSQIFPYDTTVDSLPFINDGRTTNTLGPGEQGSILPNPDLNRLLNKDPVTGAIGSNVVQWPATSISGSLPLNGQVNYFPNGVTFTSTAQITGQGTIVVDNGNPAVFSSTGTIAANIIVLRRPDQMPSTGNPSITFLGDNDVTGLVYAHQNIDIQHKFNLTGMMIAYNGAITTNPGPPVTFKYDPSAIDVPGFDAWATSVGTPQSGPGPVFVISWQRL